MGEGACKYLAPVNAENFMSYKGNLETGMTPRVGACMVWQKGATLKGSDGAGHVAIVEKVISDTEIVTSESGWNAKNAFWTQTRKKGNGNWGQASGYKFLGFIYNPSPDCKSGATTTTTTAPATPAKPTTAPKAEVAKYMNTSLKGSYKTTSDLHLRTGAGTGKTSILVMSKGATVRNYGYFNKDGSTQWLYVQYTDKNGQTFTGYCHKGYLKKI